MSKYRKKPVVIEAIQWTGENGGVISEFCKDNCKINRFYNGCVLVIKTLEGDHIADKGDMIIKGEKGEFYPCKPDIFKMTYEKVEG